MMTPTNQRNFLSFIQLEKKKEVRRAKAVVISTRAIVPQSAEPKPELVAPESEPVMPESEPEPEP
jgi:hypothetical protein